MSGEMVTVHRAANLGEADIIAQWLEAQGIPTFVKSSQSLATLPVPSAIAPRGVEICVPDDETAEAARTLLAEHQAEVTDRLARLTAAPPIDVVCEACGGTTEFPAIASGTVQSCAHCHAHIDVPEI
jgi:hypothetical protein